MLKDYYSITKPGIIYGNLLTAAGGFFLASKDHIDFGLLIATMLGMSLIIASACVFNNYIDRDIDKLMSRTKKRLIVTGKIPLKNALIYATILGVVGALILIIFVNVLTFLIGITAFFVYVVLYGITKRSTVHGTIVGSIAGAAPIVAGYTAVTNRFDFEALLLFFILVFWQMPHFYSIAIYRKADYKAAKIPVLPIAEGNKVTKVEILVYVALFAVVCSLLSVFGYTGMVFRVVMLAVSIWWLYIGFKGFKSEDNKWARKMFGTSLIVIMVLSVMLSLNQLLS
jgi:protoheme IX farnesyltransferase